MATTDTATTGTVPPSTTVDTSAHGSAPGTVSRRTVLGAAAVAVAGWSVGAGGWVDAAHAATTHDLRNLPSLRGEVVLAGDGFRADFGRYVSSAPRAVLRPARTSDVSRMLTYCALYRIPVAMNGQSGPADHRESHSNYGQALTDGGLQIDASTLGGVRSVGTGSAVVGPGATWAEVVTAALATGQTVPTLPDYLHLSVGGTVSVGGIGGNVQRFGLSSDLVREVEVVTGLGEVLRASRTRNSTLFDVVLAGGGQFGIITELVLDLVPAESTATITSLYYDDVATYVADQRVLLAAGVFDHHGGEIVRDETDTTWGYKIDVGTYHSTPQPPDRSALLDQLRDDRTRRETFSLPYEHWAFRVDEFADALLSSGHWEMKKPWLSLLVPGTVVEEFMAWAEPQLTGADIGAGFCLLAPMSAATVRTPNFVLPPSSDGTVFFFDLLAFPHPGTTGLDEAVARNRRFYDKLVALGGKRYIIGAVPMSVLDWRQHYGLTRYLRLSVLKRLYDPRGILTPGQGMFS